MSTWTVTLLADIGALLLALGVFVAALLLARRDAPRPRTFTFAWVFVTTCAFVALVFAAIVLILFAAG